MKPKRLSNARKFIYTILAMQYVYKPCHQILQITLQINSMNHKYDDCQSKCKNCINTNNKKYKRWK